jgi:hypothetical protein
MAFNEPITIHLIERCLEAEVVVGILYFDGAFEELK